MRTSCIRIACLLCGWLWEQDFPSGLRYFCLSTHEGKQSRRRHTQPHVLSIGQCHQTKVSTKWAKIVKKCPKMVFSVLWKFFGHLFDIFRTFCRHSLFLGCPMICPLQLMPARNPSQGLWISSRQAELRPQRDLDQRISDDPLWLEKQLAAANVPDKERSPKRNIRDSQGWFLQRLISTKLSGPVLCETRETISAIPPYCALWGFLVSQHGQLGAIPPPPFLSPSPLESMRSGGAIPPPPSKGVSQRYLRDTL